MTVELIQRDGKRIIMVAKAVADTEKGTIEVITDDARLDVNPNDFKSIVAYSEGHVWFMFTSEEQ